MPGKDGEDIRQCVQNNTFALKDSVQFLKQGKSGKMVMTDANEWTPDFTDTKTGMCYKFDKHFKIGTGTNGAFIVGLNENITFFLFIHDPKLFIVNLNSLMPITQITKSGDKMTAYEMIIVQHDNLDLPSKPCHPSPSYSLTSCIKETLSRDIGCRLPWDSQTEDRLPKCHHLDQYRWLDVQAADIETCLA